MSWRAMSEGDAATDGVGWFGLDGDRRRWRGLVWSGTAMGERDECDG